MKLPSHFYWIALLTFFSYCFHFLVPFSIPLLASDGIGGSRAGFLLGVAFLFAGLWQPLVGRALEKKHFARIVIVGMAAALLGGVLFALQVRSILLTGVATIASVFSLCSLGTLVSLVQEVRVPGPVRLRAVNFSFLCVNAGWAVSGLLAFLFLENHRTALVFFDVITSLVLYLGLFHVLRKTRTETKTETPPRNLWRDLFRLPNIGQLFFQICFASYLSVIPLLFEKNQLDVTRFTGVETVVNCLCVVALSLAMHWKALPWSDSRRLIFSAFFLSVSLGAMPFCKSYEGVALATALWSVGEVVGTTTLTTVLISQFGPHQEGLAAGMRVLISRMAMFLSPLVGSLLTFCPQGVSAVILAVIPILGLYCCFSHSSYRRCISSGDISAI